MHHSASLNHYWKDKEKIRKLTDDYQNADLSESDVAICNYAVKLTQKPASSEIPQLIEELRNKGLSDQTIHDVALVTSYFNFVNRIVLPLAAAVQWPLAWEQNWKKTKAGATSINLTVC